MEILAILGQITAPVFNFFGQSQAIRASQQAARNPNNQAAAAAAQNQQLLAGLAVLILFLIIAITYKNRK